MVRTAARRVHFHWIRLSRSHQVHPHDTAASLDSTSSVSVSGDQSRRQPPVTKCCLPGSSQCTRPGCSRFRPSCSGTPATSVCCSSPGLRSFLRPRSAASWAPPIGKRTETGTCFINTLKPPKWREKRYRAIWSPRAKISALLEVI